MIDASHLGIGDCALALAKAFVQNRMLDYARGGHLDQQPMSLYRGSITTGRGQWSVSRPSLNVQSHPEPLKVTIRCVAMARESLVRSIADHS